MYTVPTVALRKDPTKAKCGYTLGFHDFAALEDGAIFAPKNSVWWGNHRTSARIWYSTSRYVQQQFVRHEWRCKTQLKVFRAFPFLPTALWLVQCTYTCWRNSSSRFWKKRVPNTGYSSKVARRSLFTLQFGTWRTETEHGNGRTQAAKSHAHPLPPTLHYVISPLGVYTGCRLHSATAYHVQRAGRVSAAAATAPPPCLQMCELNFNVNTCVALLKVP